MPIDRPSISVIIPHLNQPDQLGRCLASLRGQVSASPDVEIIVVDNGSRQMPSAVCAKHASVVLAQEPTPGPGPARNQGIGLSSGEILAFIDADCIAHDGWLAAVATAFAADSDLQIIGGDVRIAVADPSKLTALEAYESIFAYRQEEYITRQGFSGTGNLAMRRAVFAHVGPFAGIAVAEDRDWGRRATAMGYRIRYSQEMIVYHPARDSITELYRKWERHVSHDFTERRPGAKGMLLWLVRAVAVAGSPIFEARRIATSRRVPTWHDKWLAATVLARTRAYRAARMFAAPFLGSLASRSWNRR